MMATSKTQIIIELRAEVSKLKKEIKARDEAFDKIAKYASHYTICRIDYDGKCSCGYEQALKGDVDGKETNGAS